ncbi:MAG: helix-turn-helix domain-containing protein [Oscillospiraceae bacterium]|nr:helix-turn-helix domain-containing protein [Oscillospiraceae bacterium]
MVNHEQWLIDFGARLRSEREKQALTRSALAQLAHTEQGYIVQIESGNRSPSLRTFINLLSALGVSADSLIFGTPKEQGSDMERALDDYTAFLLTRTVEEVKMLFEISKDISKYKDASANETG